jgi:5-formyltetrahydrofolate cyclo-ligase
LNFMPAREPADPKPGAADAGERRQLRRQCRAARRALPIAVSRSHGEAVARHATTSGLVLPFRRIALYLPNDGELETGPLLARLLDAGKSVALPCVADGVLRFLPYRPDMALVSNSFGIPEPDLPITHCWLPASIGLILMPLVAYDERGFRLGMGGGYYDRALRSVRPDGTGIGARPLLIGLAHSLQQVARVPAASWDVPLDGVLTECGLQAFSARARRFSPAP